MNVIDLLNNSAILHKSTEDFIECYKTQLRAVGIPADSDERCGKGNYDLSGERC